MVFLRNCRFILSATSSTRASVASMRVGDNSMPDSDHQKNVRQPDGCRTEFVFFGSRRNGSEGFAKHRFALTSGESRMHAAWQMNGNVDRSADNPEWNHTSNSLAQKNVRQPDGCRTNRSRRRNCQRLLFDSFQLAFAVPTTSKKNFPNLFNALAIPN